MVVGVPSEEGGCTLVATGDDVFSLVAVVEPVVVALGGEEGLEILDSPVVVVMEVVEIIELLLMVGEGV